MNTVNDIRVIIVQIYMGLSIFSITEVISFLKNNDYDKFNFKDELAIIYANDIEMLFELCNGSISEELGEIAVSVLENLENCISKAQIWLEHFNVKKTRHSQTLLIMVLK